jgi:prepilin-type N-terminal cleavage/methylation domain-containing protein
MRLQRHCLSRRQRGILISKGFTLLELLISMSLFLLVIVIMGGSLRLGFRSLGAVEGKSDALERFRSSWEIIMNQIQSAVPLTYDQEGAKKYYFKGDATQLQFATSRSAWGEERGGVIVSYRLESGERGRMALYASERSTVNEETREVMLFDDLKTLSFSYFGREVLDAEGTWTQQWDDPARYPEQVKMNLLRDQGEVTLLFPLYARAKK